MSFCSHTFAAIAAAAVIAGAATTASAGFTAISGSDAVSVLASAPAVGNELAISAGTFSFFDPDTLDDPQIAADLDRYGYTFDTVGIAANVGGSFTYTGTYELFYNLDSNDVRDPGDLRVSSGNLMLIIVPVSDAGGTEFDVIAGSLTQLLGPELPAFADLSYGGSNVGVIGTIHVPVSAGPVTGTANLNFTQTALVPEPASLALVALGGALVLSGRRGRRA